MNRLDVAQPVKLSPFCWKWRCIFRTIGWKLYIITIKPLLAWECVLANNWGKKLGTSDIEDATEFIRFSSSPFSTSLITSSNTGYEKLPQGRMATWLIDWFHLFICHLSTVSCVQSGLPQIHTYLNSKHWGGDKLCPVTQFLFWAIKPSNSPLRI